MHGELGNAKPVSSPSRHTSLQKRKKSLSLGSEEIGQSRAVTVLPMWLTATVPRGLLCSHWRWLAEVACNTLATFWSVLHR